MMQENTDILGMVPSSLTFIERGSGHRLNLGLDFRRIRIPNISDTGLNQRPIEAHIETSSGGGPDQSLKKKPWGARIIARW